MIGQLQDGYEFYPAAHAVPLTDLIRDPSWNLNVNDYSLTREQLDPVIHPQNNTYILESGLLEDDLAFNFLAENYMLDTDYGERFASLVTLPKIVGVSYPRTLYRYAPNAAGSTQ